MARIDTLSNFLTDVSSAIKQKTGGSNPIPASSFDTEILSITTGGTYQTKSQSIATNGNYIITPDTGYDAIEQLNLSVTVPTPVLQTKTITENGVVNPDQGYDGFSQVIANIHHPTKMFESVNQMTYEYDDKREGDYAIVANNKPMKVYSSAYTFTELYFNKQNIVLDSAYMVTGEIINEIAYTGVSGGTNNEYVHIFMDETKFELTIHKVSDDSVISTIVYRCAGDGITYIPDEANIEWFVFSDTMAYTGTGWDSNTWGKFLYYIRESLLGLYTYKAPFTEIDNLEHIYPMDYTNSITTTESITPTYLSIPMTRQVLCHIWFKYCAWAQSPSGTYIYSGGAVLGIGQADSTIVKGYAYLKPNSSGRYDMSGSCPSIMLYNNNYYICTTSDGYSLNKFEFNIETDTLTTMTPTIDLTVNNKSYTKLQNEDMTHILGRLYNLEITSFSTWQNGTYAFIYKKTSSEDYYTQNISLKFDTTMQYHEIQCLPSGLTATQADVVAGKTFYNDGNKTGTMQVITYPYPYSEYHNYDYEFYTANQIKNNVNRDNVKYVLLSYQVVPGSQPDTWALTGNRKMKLGVTQSQLASAIGLTADKIKAGVTILGITGTYTGN